MTEQLVAMQDPYKTWAQKLSDVVGQNNVFRSRIQDLERELNELDRRNGNQRLTIDDLDHQILSLQSKLVAAQNIIRDHEGATRILLDRLGKSVELNEDL